jgi:predicted dehydrogenase
MKKTNKNLILVGCGKRGSGHLRSMEKFNKFPNAFCDFNPKPLEIIQKNYKSSDCFIGLDSLKKFINPSSENFAIVAVDAKNNYKVSKSLLESGINVLMEKPPGLSITEAENLIDISKRNDLDCFIGFDRRFNPYVSKSLEILSEYGKTFNIQAEFNKDINEWIGHRAFDDNLLDKMVLESPIHSIDLMNYLSKSNIKNVNGSSSRIGSKYRTSFSALVEYENGITGSINSSYLSSGRMERYSIHAEKCSIYLDGINSGKVFYNSNIFDLEVENFSSTELQMKNFLEYVYKGSKFNGAKIEEALNIFKITDKMFENTLT